MTSYMSRGLNSPSEINVVPSRIIENPLNPVDPFESDDDVGVALELVRINYPENSDPKRKIPEKKSKFERLKKIEYWVEGMQKILTY